MTAVPRCSAPRAAVADIRGERSTESSDAPCGLRAELEQAAVSAVATFVSFWQRADPREGG